MYLQKECPKLNTVDKSGFLTLRQMGNGLNWGVAKKRILMLQVQSLIFCKKTQVFSIVVYCV